MARIEPAAPIDPAALEAADAQGRLELQTVGIYEHRPASSKAFFTLLESFGEDGDGTLSARLLELVRLRIAFWNQCRSCMSMRYRPELVDEGTVCSLESPDEADDLSGAEKAALHYADLLATENLAVDDAVYEDLRRYFAEGEIVELGMFCGLCIGSGRVAATWKLTEHLDERFQGEQDEPFVPWAGGALR
jgi:alkylhydroperoxidase family enzyme